MCLLFEGFEWDDLNGLRDWDEGFGLILEL